jgi:hypothetical protein
MSIAGVLAETQTRHLPNVNQKSWCHCYSLALPNSVPSEAVDRERLAISMGMSTTVGSVSTKNVINRDRHLGEDVKYLGLHLDRRLTWHKHIFAKRKQLGITLTKMYWLLGRKSKLSSSNKLLIYKTILKPIWTYGIQLWGTASTSNIEILERFQSKAPHMIVNAPWYVPNTVIRRDLQIPTVKEEIRRYSSQYSARLSAHPSNLIVNLIELPDNRRLRRHLPNDLPTRFLV